MFLQLICVFANYWLIWKCWFREKKTVSTYFVYCTHATLILRTVNLTVNWREVLSCMYCASLSYVLYVLWVLQNNLWVSWNQVEHVLRYNYEITVVFCDINRVNGVCLRVRKTNLCKCFPALQEDNVHRRWTVYFWTCVKLKIQTEINPSK